MKTQKAERVCPECKKHVIKKREYSNGDILYIHEEEVTKHPFPHVDITDSCYVAQGGENDG